MKVIKYGDGYEPVISTVVCCECSSVLEYTRFDRVEFNSGVYLQCPVCGEMMGWYQTLEASFMRQVEE